MDFAALLEAINLLLDRMMPGAKLPPDTSPGNLAAQLSTAASLLGVDPNASEDNRPIGPVENDHAAFAQMSGTLGFAITDFPRVLKIANQFLASAYLTQLPKATKPHDIAGALTQILMDDLRKQVTKGNAPIAQMGGRLARVPKAKRDLSERYEMFTAAGHRPDRALKMARNADATARSSRCR